MDVDVVLARRVKITFRSRCSVTPQGDFVADNRDIESIADEYRDIHTVSKRELLKIRQSCCGSADRADPRQLVRAVARILGPWAADCVPWHSILAQVRQACE